MFAVKVEQFFMGNDGEKGQRESDRVMKLSAEVYPPCHRGHEKQDIEPGTSQDFLDARPYTYIFLPLASEAVPPTYHGMLHCIPPGNRDTAVILYIHVEVFGKGMVQEFQDGSPF